jgi:hypothetical protein
MYHQVTKISTFCLNLLNMFKGEKKDRCSKKGSTLSSYKRSINFKSSPILNNTILTLYSTRTKVYLLRVFSKFVSQLASINNYL